jgi:hypothetical protein
MKICVDCKHCTWSQGDPRDPANYLCRARSRPATRDPVTGATLYRVRGGKGELVLTREAYFRCQEINRGDCQQFEREAS